MVAAKTPLKTLPGFSQGVRANAALRDVVLAQPICPKSQIRGKMVDGHYEAPEIGPGDENCQRAGGSWWEACEEKGHNPFFRNVERVVTRNVVEENENGEREIVGTRKFIVGGEELNVTSVSTATRLNSGQGVRIKKRRYGYRSLSEMGYNEVCQYRGCIKPITIKHRYGDFCGIEHLQLIAADVEEVTLTRTDHDSVPGQRLRSRGRGVTSFALRSMVS